jgi:hypothetical protein
MRTKMKTISIIATAVLALAGCKEHRQTAMTKQGEFNGYSLEIGIDQQNREYLRMWGDKNSNRGYRPAYLFARNDDLDKPGFEYVDLNDARDLSESDLDEIIDRHNNNPLKKFAEPITCERIFRYVEVDSGLE